MYVMRKIRGGSHWAGLVLRLVCRAAVPLEVFWAHVGSAGWGYGVKRDHCLVWDLYFIDVVQHFQVGTLGSRMVAALPETEGKRHLLKLAAKLHMGAWFGASSEPFPFWRGLPALSLRFSM